MKKKLYIGLEAPPNPEAIHCPLIEVVPRATCPEILDAFSHLPTISHVIMTSKTAVRCFFSHLSSPSLVFNKQFFSVGKATNECLKGFGIQSSIIASMESQEGIIECIQKESPASLFWGRSSLSRPLLADFIKESHIPLTQCILYDTIRKPPIHHICFDEIDEIFFSSPSTVDAFCFFFGALPKEKKLHAQGPITELAIKQRL